MSEPIDRRELEKQIALLERIRNDNLVYEFKEGGLWKPNAQQARLIEGWKDPRYKTFTFYGSNQKGKTTIGIIIAICVMAGEWLWSGEKIKFPHNEPRIITYTGQGWETHIQKTVEPDLIRLWPKSRKVETYKNNQGVQSHWIDKQTKSELFIMSNNQDSVAFEGDKVDLRVWDEPPKRENRIAGGRGLMARNGRELFVATNLNAAWFVREVIKKRLPNGEPDLSVCNVKGSIWDNVSRCKCGEYILRETSINGRIIGECPKCGNVKDYERFGLTIEGVERYKSTLTASEIKVRIEGDDYTQETLVFPNFNRDVHVREEFAIPLDWLVDISIDFHPSKKWAVVFMATARNGIKYICNEIHEHGNPKYIAEQIVRKMKQNHYRIGRCVIDPLSKGDSNNEDTVYDRVSQTLGAYGISLETASKDKDIGIALVNNLLWTENEMPGLYYFKSCPMSIQQTEDLMYDPDSLKPTAMKVEDDFTECIYRLALLNTQWFPETTYQGNKINMVL